MGRLEGKVALITGAAKGIGRATAMYCAKEGAKVVITDIDQVRLYEAAKEIRLQNGSVKAILQDVSNADDWRHVVDVTREEFG